MSQRTKKNVRRAVHWLRRHRRASSATVAAAGVAAALTIAVRQLRKHRWLAQTTGLAAILSLFILAGSQTPKISPWLSAQEQEVRDTPEEWVGEVYDWVTDAKRHIESLREQVEDRERELKNNFRDSQGKIDFGTVQNLLTQKKAAIDELESLLSGGSSEAFWDRNQDLYNEVDQSLDDAFSQLYGQDRYIDFTRLLTDSEGSLKSLERDLKDTTRTAKDSSLDLATLQGYVESYRSGLEAVRAKYNALSIGDPNVQDAVMDLEDELSDIDYLRQDFWDANGAIHEVANREQTRKDGERTVKDIAKSIKDQDREVKNRQREGVDTSELERILSERKAILEELRNVLANPEFDPQEFWDVNQTISDLDRDFRDLENEFIEVQNTAQQEENAADIAKDKARNITEMERELKRVKGEGGETGQILMELKALYEQMLGAIAQGDFETLWDLNRDFDEGNSRFYEAANLISSAKDIGRWLKDIARELGDKKGQVQDLDRQARRGEVDAGVVADLSRIRGEMETLAQQAYAAYQAKEYEDARDLLNEDFNDLRQEFEFAASAIYEGQQHQFARNELLQIGREIEEADHNISVALSQGSIDAATADLCRGYLSEGRGYLQQLQSLTDRGDEATAEEIGLRLERLGQQVDASCGDLFEDQPHYDAYVNTYVPDEHQDIAADIFEKVRADVAQRVFEQLMGSSGILNAIFEGVGQQFQDQIAATIGAFSFVPEDRQQDILSRKKSLLEEVANLEAQVQELRTLAAAERTKLDALREQLASHTFVSDEGTRVEEQIEEFLAQAPSLNSAEVRAEIADLEEEVASAIESDTQNAYEQSFIPFRDTPFDAWFTGYVHDVKEEGLVQGTGTSGGKEYDPEVTTNWAEGATMLARLVGVDLHAVAGTTIGRSAPDWSQQSFATLEGYNGLDLDSVAGGDRADSPLKRWQVAVILATIFQLPTGDASVFDDISQAPAWAEDAIGAVASAGIMTGQGDGTTFDPRGFVNRAQLAAILSRVTSAGSPG